MVFRVRPNKEFPSDPLPAPVLRTRGTGQTEMEVIRRKFHEEDLAVIRAAGPDDPPAQFVHLDDLARGVLAECVAWLSTLDVCWSRVNTFPEALADPGLNARGMILRDERVPVA